MKLPCFVCGSQLENIAEGDGNQPMRGTEFTTHGHYGSTVFDPMDGSFMRLNVCDTCLDRRIGRTQHVVIQKDEQS